MIPKTTRLQEAMDKFEFISKHSAEWSDAIQIMSGEADKTSRKFRWVVESLDATRHAYKFILMMSSDRRVGILKEDSRLVYETQHIDTFGPFSITLQEYPHCCAMYQANGFFYKNPMTEDQVHGALDHITNLVYNEVSVDSRRLIFNFVESFYANPRIERFTEDYRKNRQIHKLPPLPEGTEAKIRYPFVHSWAKKQARYDEMESFNVNTHNVIHTAFVVPNHVEE